MRQQDYLCHERQTQVRGLRHYVKERVQAHSKKKDPGLGGSRKEGTSQRSARSGRDLRRDERPRKGTFEPTLKTNMNAVDESEITPSPPHPPPSPAG